MTHVEKISVMLECAKRASKEDIGCVDYEFMCGYLMSFAARHLSDAAIDELKNRHNIEGENNENSEKNI